MSSLSDEHQQATVEEIVYSLHHHWLETAVITAGPNGRVALAHFVKRFKKADEKAKLRRAYDLYRIERDADRVLPLFVEGLNNKSSTQRYYAFAGIRAMGPDAESVVPKLTQMLGNKNNTIVSQSLKALESIKPDSPEVLIAV